MDSDGPEPLATVGQLSSPHFASFFEPPLYTPEDPSSLFDKRPTDIPSFPLPARRPAHAPARASVICSRSRYRCRPLGSSCGTGGPHGSPAISYHPLSGFRKWHLNGSIFGAATFRCHASLIGFEVCKGGHLGR